MPVKVTVDLRNLKTLIPKIQQEAKKLAKNPIKKAIIKDIQSGVSPVKGKRFPKYSDSYKSTIRGEVTFRKSKSGKTFAIPEPDKEFLTHGKGISPVNLTLSGGMIKSFFIHVGVRNTLFKIGFKSFLAHIHDKKGASKKKVIRRLLPDAGESFNAEISSIIKETLQKAIKTVTKKLTR